MAEDSKPVVTEAMIEAGVQNAHGNNWGEIVVNCYRAMLAAAPVNAMSGEAGEAATQLADIEAMLDGQGDDDGPQILPDFEDGMSTLAKVEACLFLLEKRRDVIDGCLSTPRPSSELVAALRYRGALEMIAGRRPCVDNLMGNVDIAIAALDSTEGQKAGLEDGWQGILREAEALTARIGGTLVVDEDRLSIVRPLFAPALTEEQG